jgi:hypothetical protein
MNRLDDLKARIGINETDEDIVPYEIVIIENMNFDSFTPA